ncbi:uncharacterized protein LOC132803251 [Ziziphus jujuba]|uniref:Uncharacterized protein LOC132803251 n=1 Tax=Ziziphus jujuba TaxID=326968 RepID=A0ABM4A502_ZIZJJ|nr:uncharacterized protein LOC132803251 [Ziziphus jujuba]
MTITASLQITKPPPNPGVLKSPCLISHVFPRSYNRRGRWSTKCWVGKQRTDQPVIDHIINVLADEDFDFSVDSKGAFEAIGELLVGAEYFTNFFEHPVPYNQLTEWKYIYVIKAAGIEEVGMLGRILGEYINELHWKMEIVKI